MDPIRYVKQLLDSLEAAKANVGGDEHLAQVYQCIGEGIMESCGTYITQLDAIVQGHDSVDKFLKDKTKPDGEILAIDLYMAYMVWCGVAKFPSVGRKELHSYIKARTKCRWTTYSTGQMPFEFADVKNYVGISLR